jgi:magnesium transporter
LYIWDLVRAGREGDILLEVSEPVRESLISSMDTEELVAATESLDAEEIAELAPDLPQEVMDDVFSSLPWRSASTCARRCLSRTTWWRADGLRGSAGAPRRHARSRAAYLRRFEKLPSQTDQLFVVDRDESFSVCCR